jgi:hypothetical protein
MGPSHVSVLVLEVCLSMVTDDPVCVCCGVRLLLCARYVSTQIVVKSLEQTFSKIHIANGVDAIWELN